MILVATTMVCLASVIMFMVASVNKDQLNAAVKESLRRSNNLLMTTFDQHQASISSALATLENRPELLNAVETRDKKTLTQILARFEKTQTSKPGDLTRSIDAVFVLNKDRRTLAKGLTPAMGTLANKDLMSQVARRSLAVTEDTGTRGVILAGKTMAHMVAEPLATGDVIVALDLITNEDLTRLSKVLETDLAIFNEGTPIASTAAGGAPKESAVPLEQTIGTKTYYVMSARVPGWQDSRKLTFATLVKYQNVAGSFDLQKQWMLMVFALALVGAVVSGIFISLSLTKPLESVIFAAKVIQQGAWPARLATNRRDEIGLLQNVFDEMTVSMKVAQERLVDLVNKDPLTELFNHTTFKSKLESAVEDHTVTHGPLAMLIVDPDHFGEYNKLHGHKAGDEALQVIARTIKHSVPENAVTSRYGGEEFGIFLPYTTPSDASIAAENVRRRIEFALGQTGRPLTVSVGFAVFPEDARSAELLALGAELGTTLSKQKGRNKTCRFIPSENGGPEALQSFLKDGSSATVLALAQAVDAKDPYTHGHSTRVAEYARDLAGFVNLSDAVIELVYRTGQLHDVGKIGVPDAILKKPGRLDDDERAVMEQHPELGEKIVAKVPHLSDTLPGIRGHHERWDGRGYPDGISGENIPLVARLLAVADTFDAMTSDRPYRKGLDLGFSINEIEKGAGTQFDPHLAKAFAIMMRERYDVPRVA